MLLQQPRALRLVCRTSEANFIPKFELFKEYRGNAQPRVYIAELFTHKIKVCDWVFELMHGKLRAQWPLKLCK